jgi:hypothetical protein
VCKALPPRSPDKRRNWTVRPSRTRQHRNRENETAANIRRQTYRIVFYSDVQVSRASTDVEQMHHAPPASSPDPYLSPSGCLVTNPCRFWPHGVSLYISYELFPAAFFSPLLAFLRYPSCRVALCHPASPTPVGFNPSPACWPYRF